MLKQNTRREPRAGTRNHLFLLCVFVSFTLLGLFALDAAAQKSAEKKKKPDGLELELVEGGELAAPKEAKKEIASKPLGEKETRAVIERLGKKAPEAKEEKFAFPSSTLPPPVTGTQTVMMAATLAPGETGRENAAREPEVLELATVLNRMGADVRGAGGDRIVVTGVKALRGIERALVKGGPPPHRALAPCRRTHRSRVL